ncbi:MAG: D-aminoacyl-tRNA deacylase [Bacteroidales bacterium]
MRVVIQRVSISSVSVNAEVIGKIGPGLLVLLGVETGDQEGDIEWLCNKLVNLRIFNDDAGVMNCSVKDSGGDVLVVSQFTLHASTKKGNRPSYIRAADPETANDFYIKFIDGLESLLGKKVQSGKFGAMMEVSLVNDGPVTILMDTKNKE